MCRRRRNRDSQTNCRQRESVESKKNVCTSVMITLCRLSCFTNADYGRNRKSVPSGMAYFYIIEYTRTL